MRNLNKERHNEQALKSYYENKEKILEKKKKKREQIIEKILQQFGRTCFICGTDVKVKYKFAFHEISGRKHKNAEYLKNPENFVLLCKRCHLGVHFCMELLSLSWKEILELRE